MTKPKVLKAVTKKNEDGDKEIRIRCKGMKNKDIKNVKSLVQESLQTYFNLEHGESKEKNQVKEK